MQMENRKDPNYKGSVYMDDDVEVIKESGITKYKKAIAYIEDEMYTTLAYLNKQLDLIDEQTAPYGEEPGEKQKPVRFNKFVYDSKKQIVEQKINTLRSLASIAAEQFKVDDKTKGNEITNITELFQN